jgi:hypothetical protein
MTHDTFAATGLHNLSLLQELEVDLNTCLEFFLT